MKRTLLTFLAVGFGCSVAFAQAAPEKENQMEIKAQPEQAAAQQGEQAKHQVEMSELPQAAQDAFNNGQYSDLQVLAIYEIPSNPVADAAMTKEQGIIYEFELAQAQTENSADAGTIDDGLAGVETERVNERQPDILLHIGENGQIVKEENLDEMEEK